MEGEEALASASESSSAGTMIEQPLSTITITTEDPNAASNEATLDSSAFGGGGTESTCNNDPTPPADNAEEGGSGSGPEADPEKTLQFAAELAEKGANALKENDYAEAVDCFSRALEIRVLHYGELASECVSAYYQYGRTLLYKAQEEADPLGAVPKKEGDESKQGSDTAGKNANGESSVASASSNAEGEGSSNPQEGVPDGDGSSDSEDDEDLAEADEDESDLDLAWKMLDLARAIADKKEGDTMDKVDILSTLAEVALEREDIETSLSDYQKALSILEGLVEPDSRYIAELNFRICLCLEIGCKPQEAIPYCQKAISVCKSRIQRFTNEVKNSSDLATSSSVSEANEGVQESSTGFQTDKSVTDKKAEIETLTGLSEELEKKLEDLRQLVSNPKSILCEVLGMVSAKAKGGEKAATPAMMSPSQMATANNSADFDSSTLSTAHTNGTGVVTHLGVVGRGVKRVLTNTGSAESSPAKKPAVEPSSDKADGSNC